MNDDLRIDGIIEDLGMASSFDHLSICGRRDGSAGPAEGLERAAPAPDDAMPR
jgi:hypothetical protein